MAGEDTQGVGPAGGTLYRLVRSAGRPFRVEGLLLERFGGLKYNLVPVAEPQDPGRPVAEFGCNNPVCPVSGLTLRLDGHLGPAPQSMKCPACGEALAFRSWVGAEVLLPLLGR